MKYSSPGGSIIVGVTRVTKLKGYKSLSRCNVLTFQLFNLHHPCPENFLGILGDCPCTTTSSRTWLRSVFLNHQGILQKTPESKVSPNISGCTENQSDSRRNSGRAKRVNCCGAQNGKRCSNGKRPSRSGSSEANSTSRKTA